MVNNGSVPPSCREVPRQCSQSETACPWVNAYSPEPGLTQYVVGDIWFLPRVCERSFFMVLFLWGDRQGVQPAGWRTSLLYSREGLVPALPTLEWAGTRTASTSVQGIRKASISSQYGRNVNSEASGNAGKDNCR